MHHWHLHFVRADGSNEVRQWANLEGKSAAMRHDLERRFVAPPRPKKFAAGRIGLLSELTVVLLDAWWHIRSR